jgi:thiol-disulfide isomerase/thioredoxin
VVIQKLPDGSYPLEPLAAGTPLPLMEAEGWIQGTPQQPGEPGPRLVVLDIWSHWCMACRETAPGLVRLQQKFADRQVAFVSLTNVDRQQVENFATHANIPWPCGYGASLESLSRYGAYCPTRMSKMYNPGYEVQPTLYVIGADGKILWHDDQARPRHLKRSDALLQDLEATISQLLAAEG